ncbi:hypothetical protein GGX14DRAFT_190703 [Mycena pura]|uniref:Uncharacterized protein n=1 Tax=Mycena pura TaxID=153505 RepID=A0AAD6YKN4_9AGAR|nr:hypothetical protein GGX14DRAFT_190703 [Mycena pura]
MIPSRQGRGARAAGRGVPRCVGCARAAKPEWRMPQRATCWTPLRRATMMMRTWQGRGRSCTWRMRVLAPACAVMDAARWAASHGQGARVCAEPDASGGVRAPACHVFMPAALRAASAASSAGTGAGAGATRSACERGRDAHYRAVPRARTEMTAIRGGQRESRWTERDLARRWEGLDVDLVDLVAASTHF